MGMGMGRGTDGDTSLSVIRGDGVVLSGLLINAGIWSWKACVAERGAKTLHYLEWRGAGRAVKLAS